MNNLPIEPNSVIHEVIRNLEALSNNSTTKTSLFSSDFKIISDGMEFASVIGSTVGTLQGLLYIDNELRRIVERQKKQIDSLKAENERLKESLSYLC